MILKSYMDKFYRYEKERWEAPYLEYTDLTANNNNFVGEYKITYAFQGDSDQAAARVESLITDSADLLAENKGLGEYEKSEFCNRFVLLDYQNHLYTPLVCTQNSDPRLQISPVSLNEGEKKFIDYLKEYTDNHAGEWNDKSLYILRNKSKSGI